MRGASRRLLVGLALLGALAQAQAASFELPFWATRDTSGDARVVALHEPPGCPAPIAVARVERMPGIDDSALRTDVAIEFDAQGTELARWPLPVNAIVVGLAADRLIVPLPWLGGRPLLVAIRSQGQLSLAGEFDPATAASRARPEPCPMQPGFQSKQCWRVLDSERGAERLLAYPRPCA